MMVSSKRVRMPLILSRSNGLPPRVKLNSGCAMSNSLVARRTLWRDRILDVDVAQVREGL